MSDDKESNVVEHMVAVKIIAMTGVILCLVPLVGMYNSHNEVLEQ